jgi:hypothetical protein
MPKSEFWDAFWEGLASPVQVYSCRHDSDEYRRVGRVETAWNNVGRLMYDSIESLAAEYGRRDSGGRK